MQENNLTSLRAMLEQLPVEQLNEMLRTELEKETPEKAAVQMLLSVLEKRQEPDRPLTSRERAAWERYQKRQAEIARAKRPKLHIPWRWVAAVATVVLLIGFGSFVPLNAQAETLFQMVFRWGDDNLEIFGSGGPDSEFIEYSFQTDNPGLQQVYDAVVELGVDFPAVPMWLPEGYELVECKTRNTPRLLGVTVIFSNGEDEISYKVDIFDKEVSHEYYITKSDHETHEYFGVTYHLAQNYDHWVAIWSEEDNIECFLTVDCQEDILHKILRSIYMTEED